MKNKILSRSALLEWVRAQRSDGKTIGFTCGAFDILHAGHVDYLQRARALCDRLLVAVNSDDSVRQYKSATRPFVPEQERMAIIAALECVDAVTLLYEQRPLDLIRQAKPDFYIKGGDYLLTELKSKDEVESYGGKVVVIPVTHHTSTSSIIERVRDISCYADEPARRGNERERIAFLDRDGTLIREIPFLHDPGLVELLPGVGEGLAALQQAGFRLVMVTNQQGIGLGYYSPQEFIEVNRALFRSLSKFNVRISRVYFCPHSYADDCACRKPGDLLLQKAMRYFAASPEECYMIGDSPVDAAAARQAGCMAVLVGGDAPCDFHASSFGDAAHWILSHLADHHSDSVLR
ncbi:MAG: HAD-IIIA family hydrolase [Bryobacteraceae bacterium]|jgi:rfaE bifunctional protein nucleotidyltransferase chain/domain